MTLRLFAHPFSSYCQKVLVALYEHAVPFDFAMVDDAHPDHVGELTARWPFGRFPVLADGERTVAESSIIIEYLDRSRPEAARMIPGDPDLALDVRMLDRVFDNDVMGPMMTCVFDAIRPADARDPYGVEKAHAKLDTAYRWLDATLGGREWAAGARFTLADCAAAPALFYADWVHPIAGEFATLRAYRARLLARPSFARAVDEARPFRAYFPPAHPTATDFSDRSDDHDRYDWPRTVRYPPDRRTDGCDLARMDRPPG